MKKLNRKFTPAADAPAAAETPEVRVLHAGGKPVPEEFAHLINYAMTDEGQEEARLRDLRDGTRQRVSVVSDTWDKTLQRKSDSQPWDGFDPLVEAVQRIQEPGFKYRALSVRACDKRSLRGWEPCLDTKGNQVKVGSLFLGRMPEEVQQKRNEHYRQIGEDALRNAEEQYKADQEKLVRDAKVSGLAPLRAGENVQDYEEPGLAVPIGVRSVRGDEGTLA